MKQATKGQLIYTVRPGERLTEAGLAFLAAQALQCHQELIIEGQLEQPEPDRTPEKPLWGCLVGLAILCGIGCAVVGNLLVQALLPR